MLVVSPTSVLHVIPADKKSTRAFIDKHTAIKAAAACCLRRDRDEPEATCVVRARLFKADALGACALTSSSQCLHVRRVAQCVGVSHRFVGAACLYHS